MHVFAQRKTADQDAARAFAKVADGFAHPLRAPILHTPDELGLAFEDVTFASADGVPIEAWFIPRAGSDRLVICNHPLNFNRYGCPTDVEPFLSLGEWAGNDFEVNYVEDYRILHEAGYNVLTYDMRDMGRSGSGNGLTTSGRFQARDVIGSLRYAREHDHLADMKVVCSSNIVFRQPPSLASCGPVPSRPGRSRSRVIVLRGPHGTRVRPRPSART